MAISPIEYEELRFLYAKADKTQKAKFISQVSGVVSPGKRPPKLSGVEEYLASMTTVGNCPRCGSSHVVKNGKHNGHQRYRCQDCKKTVGLSRNSHLFATKKPALTWDTFTRCMNKRKSLRACAKACDISLPTAFAWRRKLVGIYAKVMGRLVPGIPEHEIEATINQYVRGRGTRTSTPEQIKKRFVKLAKKLNPDLQLF